MKEIKKGILMVKQKEELKKWQRQSQWLMTKELSSIYWR